MLSQQIGGNVPKVIANPAVTLRSGALLLPYWEEVPRLTEEEEGCPAPGSEPNAGALVSADGGRTWEPSAGLADDDTWLIEGTAAELNDGRVLHLFRTSVGTIYKSVSSDGRGGRPNRIHPPIVFIIQFVFIIQSYSSSNRIHPPIVFIIQFVFIIQIVFIIQSYSSSNRIHHPNRIHPPIILFYWLD